MGATRPTNNPFRTWTVSIALFKILTSGIGPDTVIGLLFKRVTAIYDSHFKHVVFQKAHKILESQSINLKLLS